MKLQDRQKIISQIEAKYNQMSNQEEGCKSHIHVTKHGIEREVVINTQQNQVHS